MSDTAARPSTEELEKAASVRIFEKVAAANDIDLNALSPEKLADLYAHFEANVLPDILARNEAEKQAAAVEAKLASLTEEQAFELFEKQAAAEPDLVKIGGLDALTDEQLQAGFSHFLENVLPIMAAQDFEPVTPAQAEKIAAAQEMQAKVAEAELLGRHMARGWWDEHDKIAAGRAEPEKKDDKSADDKKPVQERLKEASMAQAAEGLRNMAGAARALKVAPRMAGEGLLSGAKQVATSTPGKVVGGAAALGTAGLVGKKVLGSEKKGSVTLAPEDVLTLNKLAAAGDLAGLQKAAAEISAVAEKAAEFPPKKDDEKKSDEKKDDKGEEKKADDPSGALDLLIEQRATEMAGGWLRENGYIKDGE